jgi:hypothetical protein
VRARYLVGADGIGIADLPPTGPGRSGRPDDKLNGNPE